MRARRGLLVTILAGLIVIWVIPVAAEKMLEHSLIQPFPGSVLEETCRNMPALRLLISP